MMYGLFRESLLEPVRFNAPWIDRVHLDSVPNANIRDCFREGEASAVYRAANGELRAGRAPSRADDVQYGTPPRLEVRPRRAGQAHRTKKLQRESVRPVRVRQFKKIATLCGAGIIHNDVDGAVSLERGVHQGRRNVRSAKVPHDGGRVAAAG